MPTFTPTAGSLGIAGGSLARAFYIHKAPLLEILGRGPSRTTTQGIGWDSDEGILRWNMERAAPFDNRLLGALPLASELHWFDVGATHNGTGYTSRFERQELPIAGLNTDGSATLNFESWKFLRGLRGRFNTYPSTDPVLYVGTQRFVNDVVVWYGPYVFSPDTEYKVDVTLSGRLFSYRVDIAANDLAVMDGIDFDIDTEALY